MEQLVKLMLDYLIEAQRQLSQGKTYEVKELTFRHPWRVWTPTRFGRPTGKVAVYCSNFIYLNRLVEEAAREGFTAHDTRRTTVKKFTLTYL